MAVDVFGPSAGRRGGSNHRCAHNTECVPYNSLAVVSELGIWKAKAGIELYEAKKSDREQILPTERMQSAFGVRRGPIKYELRWRPFSDEALNHLRIGLCRSSYAGMRSERSSQEL